MKVVAEKVCRICRRAFRKPPHASWEQWDRRAACSRSCGNQAPVVEAFWAKATVRAATDCWQWNGATNAKGYGNFRDRSAHVVAFELANGPVPAGLEVDHTCRNRTCVNPTHLEAVTHQENVRRHAATITHCKHGHPLSGENVQLYVRADGVRSLCQACRKVRAQDYRKRKRAHG